MSEHSELFTILPQSEYLRMPWKNGLGETLEIAVSRENDQVLYRVSQAAVVEDGVFSDFSGLNRTLVLLKGQGMLLTHRNGPNECRHDLVNSLSIAHFAGGDLTYAELVKGPIEDLNIMVREGKATSRVEALSCSDSFFVENPGNKLFSGFYANSECELLLESDTREVNVIVACQYTVFIHQPVKITVQKGSGVAINIFSS